MRRTTLTMLLLATLLAMPGLGCESTGKPQPTADKQPIYFPQPPIPARLQFLTSFSDAERWVQTSKGGSLVDWVAGEAEQARPSTYFDSPYGIAAHHGRIYICDVGRDIVHVVDMVQKSYSTLDPPQEFGNPVNVTISRAGRKYVTDTKKGQIFVFGPDDQFIETLGNAERGWPIDVALDEDADQLTLYVADVRDAEVEVWNDRGELLRTIGTKGKGLEELQSPTNLALSPDGLVHVVDTVLQMVKIYDKQGRFRGTLGQPGSNVGGFARPKGIDIDEQGRVFVIDTQWQVLQIFDKDGKVLMVFGGPGGEPYSMGLPATVVLDKTSLEAFASHISADFQAQAVMLIVNQFGANKVTVFAFGHIPGQAMPEGDELEAILRQRAQEQGRLSEDADTPTTPE